MIHEFYLLVSGRYEDRKSRDDSGENAAKVHEKMKVIKPLLSSNAYAALPFGLFPNVRMYLLVRSIMFDVAERFVTAGGLAVQVYWGIFSCIGRLK